MKNGVPTFKTASRIDDIPNLEFVFELSVEIVPTTFL